MSTTTKFKMQFKRCQLSDETLLSLYKRLLKPRLIEGKMLKLLRQGKISKWFSGIGQEAISVGATSALLEEELIFTMHRKFGRFYHTSHSIGTTFLPMARQSVGLYKRA